MRWPSSNEIVNGSIGFTDSDMANTWAAASETWKGSPDQGIGVFVARYVDSALQIFELRIHLYIY